MCFLVYLIIKSLGKTVYEAVYCLIGSRQGLLSMMEVSGQNTACRLIKAGEDMSYMYEILGRLRVFEVIYEL